MAIAFDASSSGSGVTTSLTYAHTCTGSNRYLAVAMNNNTASATITAITYAGVSMGTAVDALVNSGANTYLYMFNLVAPASGANNVVITASPSTNINSISLSFTGAKQTNQPDAHGTVTSSISSGADQTKAITTVAANAWMIAFGHGAGDPVTAGTGTTSRATSGNAMFGTYSSNPIVTPASTSMSMTNSGFGTLSVTMLALSLSPAVASATAQPAFLLNFL